MTTDTQAAPSTASERITVIDALRGFALLGVFTANMFTGFSGWVMLDEAQRVAMFGLIPDRIAGVILLGLVDGKFYSLFSLLFGAGFAIQLARMSGKGAEGPAVFRRRMTVLLGIGLIHLIFVWFGDILTLYALSGFVLLLMRDWSDRRLLWTALGLILIVAPAKAALRTLGVPLDLGVYGLIGDLARVQGVRGMMDMSMADAVVIMRDSSWRDFFDYQFQGVIWRIGYLLESGRLLKVMALMMLGLWAGRRLVAGTLLDDRRLLWRVLAAGLVLGLFGNGLYVFALVTMDGGILNGLLHDIGYAVGVIPLALAYGAGFLLAWPRAKGVLGAFTPAGRMTLTHYLSQSVLGTMIFYGIGLGLAGRLAPPQILGLTLVLFMGQILISVVWLRLFNQGPMEALWRRLTYGRR